MGLITPKMRFRMNRWRKKWFRVKESARETSQEIFIEQKMCPACRALVDRHSRQCPYCDQVLQVAGTSPAGRLASRVVPSNVPATGLLILGNLVLFIVEYVLSRGTLLHPVNDAVVGQLGVALPMPLMIASGQYWRWITAMFLHAGWLHIGFNMWALYDLGPVCESLYGPAKFVTLYLIAGVIGNVAASLMGTSVLGASGALFGLLGLLATYGLRRRDSASRQLRSYVGRWIVYALIWTFVIPGISAAAHIGGLLGGMALGYMISDDPPMTEGSIAAWQLAQWVALVITFGAFFLMARWFLLLARLPLS
ncbi:MAG: rhomboid family intramembrane serine protease [Terriglobales bacterium]